MPPTTRVARARAARDRIAVGARVALADPGTLGLVGSLLVAFAALGIGIVPKPDPLSQLPLIGLLRETVLGRGLATAAIITGIAVLLTAWFALGRDLRAGAVEVRDLRRTLWRWALPLLATPPLFSRDAYSYSAQGNLVRHGYDPYVVGPWVIPGPFADSVDPLWATTPAPYGPVFLTLAGGVSRLTGDSVYLGVLGMRALALAGVVLLAIYLPRLAACCGVEPRTALWLGLVNPLTLMHFVSGAHNDALMLGLIVAGLTLALEGSPLAGSVVIALAAGVKAPAALALGFVGHVWARQLVRSFPALSPRQRLLRGFALAGGVGLTTFAAVTAVTRFGYGWIGALGTPGIVHSWLSPPTVLGMVSGGTARFLGLTEEIWPYVDGVRAVSGALAVLLIVTMLLRPGPLDLSRSAAHRRVVRGTAYALLLLVLLGPVVQPWYLMWALVPLAAVPLRGGEARWVRWGVVFCVVVSQLNGTTMIGWFALPGSLAALAATAVVVTRARRAERAVTASSLERVSSA